MQEGKKNPHGSLEVESGSRQHYVDVVAEDTGIEISQEPVVRFEMSDYRHPSRRMFDTSMSIVADVLSCDRFVISVVADVRYLDVGLALWMFSIVSLGWIRNPAPLSNWIYNSQ